jgi:hypothetical protein
MELVGVCVTCGASIYCKDGFLDGVTDHGRLYCHGCYSKASEKGSTYDQENPPEHNQDSE